MEENFPKDWRREDGNGIFKKEIELADFRKAATGGYVMKLDLEEQ